MPSEPEQRSACPRVDAVPPSTNQRSLSIRIDEIGMATESARGGLSLRGSLEPRQR